MNSKATEDNNYNQEFERFFIGPTVKTENTVDGKRLNNDQWFGGWR